MIAWSTSDIPDQQGRIAIITGANSGIGLETTRALAAAGATVVMACRSTERAERARAGLPEPIGEHGSTTVAELDLADPASIEQFVSWFDGAHQHVDLLVNNAGVMACPPALTSAGAERQWATNHLGHFALTGLLLAKMAPAGARIVTVSSLAAAGGDLSGPIPTDLDDYARFQVYSDTKLANQVFAVELNHRLAAAGSRTISVAAHPGLSHTNLIAGVGLPLAAKAAFGFSRLLAQSAADGALPVLRAATDPAVEGGQYYGPGGRRQYRGRPVQIPLIAGAARRSLGRSLWDQSMELSGVRYLAGS